MMASPGPSRPTPLIRQVCLRPLIPVDLAALFSLALVTLWYLRRHVDWHGLPDEDALMLLRYSSHFAQGFGIRWNVGEPPVEGATDFLYMVCVGLVSRIAHIGVISAGRILLALTHLLSVLLLYTSSRRLFAWPVWASLSLALYLAVDIARAYIGAGFSAPFYGFFALLAWYLALQCIVCGATVARSASIGVLLTLLYLIRPEGVFLGALILLALSIGLGRAALRVILPAAAILGALGGAYFLWRWHYFGYPFPNPLYLKGGGRLHFDSLVASFHATWFMLALLVPLYAVELFSSRWKRVVVALVPTLGFACIWILLSNENNFFMRFQYCGVPVAMLSLPYASTTLREKFSDFSPAPAVQSALVLVALMLSVEYWGLLVKIRPPDFALYNIAGAMSTIKDRDYVVATTEAGIVPYFSGWRAVDLYGLNDAEIVHNPRGLTQAYLEQRNPAVIFNHYPDQDYLAGNPRLRQTVQVTEEFATSHGYQLAAVWGYNLCDRDIWYVRKDIPEAQQLITAIQRFPYVISGVTMVDLRGVPVPKDCWEPPIHLGLSQ